MDGSKCAHCLQQCKSALHFGHLPFQSTSGERVVEQLKHLAATTFCNNRGRRGPVTSMGGRGPEGLGRSTGRRSPASRPESMYPRCLYFRSSSMCENRFLELRSTSRTGCCLGTNHVAVQAVGSIGGRLRNHLDLRLFRECLPNYVPRNNRERYHYFVLPVPGDSLSLIGPPSRTPAGHGQKKLAPLTTNPDSTSITSYKGASTDRHSDSG